MFNRKKSNEQLSLEKRINELRNELIQHLDNSSQLLKLYYDLDKKNWLATQLEEKSIK